MFFYTLINHPDTFSLDDVRIQDIFALLDERISAPQSGGVNVSFLPDNEIAKLNKEYRKIDASTDVLSFHYYDSFQGLSDDEIGGELIFSESRILDQSKEYRHTPEEEFEILLIHSLLHLLGYDHEKDIDFEEMFAIEKEIRGKMGLNLER